MLSQLKKLIALDNPVRLAYHGIRAILANVIYGFPSKDMTIIGVTGTNGKTTTCNIIAQTLRASWKKVFMFTTVNIMLGDEIYTNETKMTSPDAFELQSWLKRAKSEGCEVAVIETASHGIKMHRIWGIDYDTCVLTNITQDHLDLHRTMDDYVQTKLKIFKKLMYYKRKPWVKKSWVINAESEYAELFLSETYDSLYTYGFSPESNVRAENLKNTKKSMSFDIIIPGQRVKIETQLRGNFNVYNILAAAWVAMSLWVETWTIIDAIKQVSWVPGRMEEVRSPDGFSVFIDYAHTPDALENVLETLSDIKWKWRVITVFWATWDRDRTKRPEMWEVVSRHSDVVILTQDDDYSENPLEIIKDILPWIDRKQWEGFWIIPTRFEAVQTALLMAQKDDIILLAGKWDEHILMTNDGPVEWHERTIVESILKDIDDNELVK